MEFSIIDTICDNAEVRRRELRHDISEFYRDISYSGKRPLREDHFAIESFWNSPISLADYLIFLTQKSLRDITVTSGQSFLRQLVYRQLVYGQFVLSIASLDRADRSVAVVAAWSFRKNPARIPQN